MNNRIKEEKDERVNTKRTNQTDEQSIMSINTEIQSERIDTFLTQNQIDNRKKIKTIHRKFGKT